MLREQVANAALDVLVQAGLDRWTVAAVAQQAGCAKGLVHYHYQTKELLLARVADQMTRARYHDRLAALDAGGTGALDDLWRVIADAAASGRSRAWFSLQSHSSESVRRTTMPPDGYLSSLGSAVAGAFALSSVDEPQARSIDGALDGFELALARGDDSDRVHEAFHQSWLAIL